MEPLSGDQSSQGVTTGPVSPEILATTPEMGGFTWERDRHGTREWSDQSYNICMGCQHGCLYCYARSQRGRFDPAMRVPGPWVQQRLNPNQSRFGAEVGPVGVVMFPTTHDITPEFLPESLRTIKNLLLHNKVLIVSKPHLSVVRTLCRELADKKPDILFRFSIGAVDSTLCRFWEPGAPEPSERIECLKHAHQCGFATSVSMEPMLDSREATVNLVEMLEPYVSETIWVGKMQRIPQKYNASVVGFAEAVALVKEQQSDAEVLKLVADLQGHPKVRWKDSVREVLAKHGVATNEGN